MTNEYFAFIPAGSNYTIKGELKHHLNFGTGSILENTIDETLKAGFKVVTTVRDSSELKEKYHNNSNVVILESKEKLVESCVFGLVEGIINNFYDDKFRGNWSSIHEVKKHLKNPEFDNMRVIYLGSDAPFLKKEDIYNFVNNHVKNDSDLYIGMTDIAKLFAMNKKLELNLENIDSTINNYCVTTNGKLRISNMYIMNPKKIIKSGFSEVIQKIYDNRKVSKIENKGFKSLTSKLGIVSGVSKIIGKALINLPSTIKLLNNAYDLSEHVRGKPKNIVDSKDALMNASDILGFKLDVDYLCGVAPLLDVDDSDSYSLFLNNKKKIDEYISLTK